MPILDVSDILYDPDFADTFTLYTPTETIGTNGRAVTVLGTGASCIGVITQGTGDILGRTPEGDKINGSITVHSTSAMSIGNIIEWGGAQHTVSIVSDWSHYGAGFYMAACELLPLNR